jgi:mono/diheme cytochrome c family protein
VKWWYPAAAALLAVLAGWQLSAPVWLTDADLPPRTPDLANGRTMFAIGGCASCHAAAKAEGEARLLLEGGRRFVTPFGTFVAPNISTDPGAGIGGWTEGQFVSALKFGTAPDLTHYYPAFPYASYARMEFDDIRDLWAYMRTLPASARPNEPHEIGFPFSIRRAIGFWKLLFLSEAPVIDTLGAPEEVERGRYLVEAPGHCGECHTPRNALGAMNPARWLAGGPNPDGEGTIPNITPGALRWSQADIAYYLETGFTPEFDSAGGGMADVIRNTSQLSAADRAAIAAYLKEVPEVAPAAAPPP